MPQDWIDAHPADDDGLVTVTTDYPDVVPFRTFAKDATPAATSSPQFLTIGWPANEPVLQRHLRAASRSTPRCSATTPGPTTTPRSR